MSNRNTLIKSFRKCAILYLEYIKWLMKWLFLFVYFFFQFQNRNESSNKQTKRRSENNNNNNKREGEIVKTTKSSYVRVLDVKEVLVRL